MLDSIEAISVILAALVVSGTNIKIWTSLPGRVTRLESAIEEILGVLKQLLEKKEE